MKLTRLYNSIISVCISSCFVCAQPASNNPFIIQSKDQQHLRISSIFQSRLRYLYCGTNQGLYQFDGINFKEILHDSAHLKDITTLGETAGGQLCIGYNNGSVGYLENNRIKNCSWAKGSIKAAIKSIIHDDKGITWIATAGEGLYYYYQKQIFNLNTDNGLSDNYVYDLFYDKNKSAVIATTDKGVNICTFNNGKNNIQIFSSTNGLPDNIVRCIYPASKNKYWIGMQDEGVNKINLNKTVLPEPSVWKKGQVNDVLVANNKLYVATEDSGLIIFDEIDQQIINPSYKRNALISKVNCLYRDFEGNVWAAGNNQLLRVHEADIKIIKQLDTKYLEHVHSLFAAGDSLLWFNTSNGISSISLQNYRLQKNYIIEEIAGTVITSLYQDRKGNVWIGTMGSGIFILNPENGSTKKMLYKNMPGENIISITGKQNDIWITSLEGVVRINIAQPELTYTIYNDQLHGIGNKYIYHILPDDNGNVWFGTDGGGIILMKNGRFSLLKDKDGYMGHVVYKINKDNLGNIWYATYDAGLVMYSGDSFKQINKDNGLINDTITGLAISGKNIAVLHRQGFDLIDAGSGAISYLDKEQQIADLNTDLNAFTVDAGGNLYFIASDAIQSISLGSLSITRPKVIIEKVQLFLTDVNDRRENIFEHDQNNLKFQYTGLFYAHPNKLKYQYILEGYDKDWTYTNDRMQNYPRLPPGNYRFVVRVSLNNNFQNASQAAYAFTIRKPFWLQWWFITLCVFTAAIIMFLIIKVREQNFRKVTSLENEKIRSQLESLRNQINPHFLFNSFNILISEIEENPVEAVTYVENLSDFYRSLVMHRDKDLIDFEEELTILKYYCFLQEKRFGPALHIELDAAESIAGRKYSIIPMATQMLVENAIKHNVLSRYAPLHIQIFMENEFLIIRNTLNKKLHPDKGAKTRVAKYSEKICTTLQKTGSYFFYRNTLYCKTSINLKTMSQVIIIEDEEAAAARLKKLVKEMLPDVDEIPVLASIKEATEYLQKNPPPKLIFADIQLSDGTVFEIFKKVTVTSPVIFTTAYDSYTLHAFKLNSVDYLLKPIKKEELRKAIDKYKAVHMTASQPANMHLQQLLQMMQKPEQYRQRFVIRIGEQMKTIQTQDIAYFYTENKANFLVTKDHKRLLSDFTLDQLEEILNPKEFFRINRQFLISYNSIQEMHTYSKSRVLIQLNPPSKIETIVSTERSSSFKSWLADE